MKKVMKKFYQTVGKAAIRAAERTCKEVSIDDFYQPTVPEKVRMLAKKNSK